MGYYCGIDLGNKRTTVCVIDKRRQVKELDEIGSNSKEITVFFKKYRKLDCLVEAAPLAEWFSRELEKFGHKVTIVCPRKAKVALSNRGKKTDKRDAHGLAELCRSGWYEAVHRKSKEAREMRSVMTARKQLVECSNAISSSIRGILRAHGIRLESGSDEKGFPERVANAASELSPAVQSALGELLQSFELLHSQQRRMYRDLHKTAKEDQLTQRLMTIPSIGPATAAAYVATIDDPYRFADGEKVASYLGLAPSVYKSCETEYYGRITKSGDKLLRWLLVEAAHNLLTRSGTQCELKDWGLKLQASKGVGKARVAVARRLCAILLEIWKSGEVFHAESLKQAA